MSVVHVVAAAALTSLPTFAAVGLTPTTDRFGQPEKLEYPGKVHDEAELRADAAREAAELDAARPDRSAVDIHGGRIEPNLRLRATGFFRTEPIGDRWWLVTPEGHRFYLIACDSVNCREWGYSTPLNDADGRPRPELAELPSRIDLPAAYDQKGRVSFLRANLERKYGRDFEAKVDDVIRRRFRLWGFNSTGKWGYEKKLAGVPYFQDSALSWACRFGDRKDPKKWDGHVFVDMYHPDFERLADEAAARVAKLRCGDPDLIAYACDNENGWEARLVYPAMFAAPKGRPGSFACRAFRDFVAKRRGADVSKLGEADFTDAEKSAFVRTASERCHAVLRAAFRRHDPDHLFMGASQCFPSHWDWICGSLPHVDFVGIHEYSLTCLKWLRRHLPELSAAGKPFAILEFSFVCDDRGHRSYGSVTCASQRGRGLGYRHYAEHVAIEPLCLGTAHFIYYDQPVNGRTLGGEAHNFGLVSQQDRPYLDMVAEVRKTNARLFDLHAGALAEPFEIGGGDGKAHDIRTRGETPRVR